MLSVFKLMSCNLGASYELALRPPARPDKVYTALCRFPRNPFIFQGTPHWPLALCLEVKPFISLIYVGINECLPFMLVKPVRSYQGIMLPV